MTAILLESGEPILLETGGDLLLESGEGDAVNMWPFWLWRT